MRTSIRQHFSVLLAHFLLIPSVLPQSQISLQLSELLVVEEQNHDDTRKINLNTRSDVLLNIWTKNGTRNITAPYLGGLLQGRWPRGALAHLLRISMPAQQQECNL